MPISLVTLTRRRVAGAFLAGAACAALRPAAAEEAFPSKPIKIVVPTAAGGNLDVVARIMAAVLTQSMGQPVLVENRTGASSTIGTRYVAQSAPDGYTVLLVGNTFASTPAIMPEAGYDAVKDFVGVSMVARLPEVLITAFNSPYRSVAELVAAAKAKPGEITYASAGSGSVSRFATERFANQLGLRLVNVPYKGNGDAFVDLISGRVAIMFDQMSTSVPHLKAGRLRALAITSADRSSVLPDVPTFAEAGVRGFEDYTWIGFVAPAATPRKTVGLLQAAAAKALQAPEVRSQFANLGLEAIGTRPDEFTAFVKTEVVRLTKLAHDANLKME